MAIIHTSFVLAVPDLAGASTCWRDVLGFTRQMQPESWDFLVRDGCRVMRGECVEDLAPAALGSHSYSGYFTVDDIDAYHREISARGAIIPSPPSNRPRGMREMVVRTPQGHRMMFGQPI